MRTGWSYPSGPFLFFVEKNIIFDRGVFFLYHFGYEAIPTIKQNAERGAERRSF